MKRIRFIQRIENGTDENGEPIFLLDPCRIDSPESGFAKDYAIAQSIAYNGKVTVEDIPDEPQKPTTEQRVSDLEEQLVQADETAISLYEAQETQETINAQQDEALMEIYEMIG